MKITFDICPECLDEITVKCLKDALEAVETVKEMIDDDSVVDFCSEIKLANALEVVLEYYGE